MRRVLPSVLLFATALGLAVLAPSRAAAQNGGRIMGYAPLSSPSYFGYATPSFGYASPSFGYTNPAGFGYTGPGFNYFYPSYSYAYPSYGFTYPSYNSVYPGYTSSYYTPGFYHHYHHHHPGYSYAPLGQAYSGPGVTTYYAPGTVYVYP